MQPIRGVLETCIYVSDLTAAESFYRDVLGFPLIGKVIGRHAFFRCGAGVFLVFSAAATAAPGSALPLHGATGPGHVAFAVEPEDLAGWAEHLRAKGVAIELDHPWPKGRSLYFRDPAGNSLEITSATIWE